MPPSAAHCIRYCVWHTYCIRNCVRHRCHRARRIACAAVHARTFARARQVLQKVRADTRMQVDGAHASRTLTCHVMWTCPPRTAEYGGMEDMHTRRDTNRCPCVRARARACSCLCL